MKKTVIKVVIAVALVVALTLAIDGLFNKFTWFKGMFGHEATIDKTANVITEINKIAEFTTACFYEEMVIQKVKEDPQKDYRRSTSSNPLDRIKDVADKAVNVVKGDPAIVFIVKTKVRAGYDFSTLTQEDLKVSGDTLYVTLPRPDILDIITNPSDWEVFYSEGKWEDREIRAIQADAKKDIARDAVRSGLLEKAEASGQESIVSLFKTLGFSEVVLRSRYSLAKIRPSG